MLSVVIKFNVFQYGFTGCRFFFFVTLKPGKTRLNLARPGILWFDGFIIGLKRVYWVFIGFIVCGFGFTGFYRVWLLWHNWIGFDLIPYGEIRFWWRILSVVIKFNVFQYGFTECRWRRAGSDRLIRGTVFFFVRSTISKISTKKKANRFSIEKLDGLFFFVIDAIMTSIVTEISRSAEADNVIGWFENKKQTTNEKNPKLVNQTIVVPLFLIFILFFFFFFLGGGEEKCVPQVPSIGRATMNYSWRP